MTENISCSGAAIRADEPVAPATPVVVVITLPSTGSEPGGYLTGEGQVVRSMAPPSQMGVSAFAITVEQYQLDRPEHVRLDSIQL